MYMYYTWNMSRVRLTNTCARNTCNCKCCKYRRISFTIAIVDIVNIADIATQYRRNYKPHCKYRSFRKYWKYRRYSKSVSQKLQMPELHEGIQTGRNSIANIADNTDIANQYRNQYKFLSYMKFVSLGFAPLYWIILPRIILSPHLFEVISVSLDLILPQYFEV